MAIAHRAVVVDHGQDMATTWLPLAIVGPPPWCAGMCIRRPRAARLNHSFTLPHSPLPSSAFALPTAQRRRRLAGRSASHYARVTPPLPP